MNDKQNDKQRYSATEGRLVEQTVRMLEARNGEASSKDEQATVELGRLLRDAAQMNLPESNLDLREQLMAELDGGAASEQVTVSTEASSGERVARSTGRRKFWVAAAASGLLLVGGTIAYNSDFVGTLSNVAMLENQNETDVKSSDPSVVDSQRPAGPEVVFRTEMRTRQVPVTRMTTETKTRTVPVTKTRTETKQVKLADGSFQDITVQVPYTEQVAQNYTVQVPVQDQDEQNYSVQVPYTADGKRIEKSDYSKFGLDVNGQALGNDTSTDGMAFPEAETWKQKALRRQKFAEIPIPSGASNGSPDASNGGQPSEPPVFVLKALPRRSVVEAEGILDQNSGGQSPLVVRFGQLMDERVGGPNLPQLEPENLAGSELAGRSDDEEIRFRFGGNKSQQLSKTGESSEGRPAEFIAGGEFPLEPSVRRNRFRVFDPGDRNDLGLIIEDRKRLSALVEIAELEKARKRLIELRNIADQQVLEQSSSMNTRDSSGIEQESDTNALLKKMSDKFHREVREVESKLAALKDAEANTGEQYEPIFENAFIAAKGPAAISTFSIDVDTASYANMRRMLDSGQRPPADSIRLEELVNYFKYDYQQPTGEHPFSVNLDLADCPWQDGHQLLRVGLKGKDVHVAERPATNVVFLIDVSGSMSSNDKLPLLKSGFQMMSQQLGENDRVSIVTYAGDAGVVLTPTNGTQTETINNAIQQLSSGGSTHGSAGIKLAYELAQQNFIEGGVNRVMLATDGDLNVGVTSDDALVSLIKEKAAEGVFLTVLGFGSGNLKDAKLEKLADNGNGMYAYIDSTREARRVLVDQLSGSLVTIAKDVKIQVEFNPAEVKSYRLLGYENRMLETKDFDDDRKDAGEIGAGHTVTAIYQIESAKAVARPVSLPAGMKYQVPTDAKVGAPVDGQEDAGKGGLSKAALSGELATVALRYKQPEASESQRLEVSIKNQPKRFEEASDDFRFAASVAGFGMYLRNSKHRGAINADQLQQIASGAIGKDESGYRSEFIDLIRKATGR